MATRVTVFDAYGTIFDVHAPITRIKDEIGPQAEALSQFGGSSSSNTPGPPR